MNSKLQSDLRTVMMNHMTEYGGEIGSIRDILVEIQNITVLRESLTFDDILADAKMIYESESVCSYCGGTCPLQGDKSPDLCGEYINGLNKE